MVINLIASPRNVSTAFMYSMSGHSYIHPVDEPFYASYLNLTGVTHPDRDLVLKSQSIDRAEVFAQVKEAETHYPVIFIKNMAHHIMESDLQETADWKHCFLIRHPRLHIHSFTKVIQFPTLSDLGTTIQRVWYDKLISQGHQPHIIDSNSLLKNPEAVLRRFCIAMGIDFQPSMLSWNPGPKPFDGCWGPHWYQGVWKSTGFGPPKDPESIELQEHLIPLLDTCMREYQYLHDQIKE